ncbi:hypothetical protein C7974DRAFT_16112 [Boeremia exigua]|uniref:uncharacterized protein n=1 Tax=Boeremia exigua TaxID=749465 RepID=UPI001E8E3C62|nr:uncharacterized protein C7974DRAFT_16112 [Boeremia exigua]KAH6644182.1 hypothetical protein C7974DRAFT_16112 [Boeremia exigua]
MYQLFQGHYLDLRLGAVPHESQDQQGLGYDVHCILQYYVPASNCDPAESNPSHNQICGAWVEALPSLLNTRETDAFLFSAIKALATSVQCIVPTDKVYNRHAFETYCTSLSRMSKALEKADGVFRIQHCVAIMCLAVSDIMLPNTSSGWKTHLKGVGDWVESVGPDAFSHGILRTLFVGFRPLLTQTMMQQLLSRAGNIPGLLQRFDAIRLPPERADLVVIDQLWQDFRITMQSLQDWELTQRSQAQSALFWTRSDQRMCAPSDARDLWFPNLLVANSLTHFWAFMIIVKTHLDVLGAALVAQRGENTEKVEHLTDMSVADLAEMICDSMTYSLQPETKLYGPGSTFFTFTTAIDVFKSKPDQYRAQIWRCQQIAVQLAALGIQPPRV